MSEFVCKLRSESKDPFLDMLLEIEANKRGISLCTGCCYDVTDCPKSDNIHVGCASYTLIDRDVVLPKQRAWCKNCQDTIAKPIAYVRFNGRKGIVLECPRCHDRYILYQEAYIERYVGRHTKFGYIPPTYGKSDSIPRNVRDVKDKVSQQRKKEHDEYMASRLGISKEELHTMREGWKKQEAEMHKRMEQERVDFRYKMQEDNRKRKSNERRELINQGILRWDKKSRCLIDTRTGEVVKL